MRASLQRRLHSAAFRARCDFYPYWSEVNRFGNCMLEFGNVSSGFG
jgi:hypothetical protein